MLKLEFVELHGPLFLAGKNHGLKLFNKAGVTLLYDRQEKELHVQFNEKTAIIPSTNIVAMHPYVGETVKAAPPVVKGVVKAQRSTPHDHVFSDGPGKTNN